VNQLASPFRRTCSWRRARHRGFPSTRPSLRPLPPKPQRTLQTRPMEELLWTSGQDGIARPLRHGRIHCEGGVIRQAWRPLWFAAITTCGCEVTPVRSQPFKGALPCPNGTRLRTETERAEAHWGLHSCTREEEALGFAVGKLRCGHAVQEIGEHGDGELLKRVDTGAIQAASVNRRLHQLLTWA
jgi:hypothetical protein